MTDFGIDGNSGAQICRIIQLLRHGYVSICNFSLAIRPCFSIVYPLRIQAMRYLKNARFAREASSGCIQLVEEHQKPRVKKCCFCSIPQVEI